MTGMSRKSHGKQNKMTTNKREKLPARVFAFPKLRKEPLTDARHVRNALARFDQVEGVSDKDRASAFRKIKSAAKRYGVEVEEKSWRELGGKPQKKKLSPASRKRVNVKSGKK